MGLTAAPMTDAAVRELSRWQYDGEYAVYDESPYKEKRAKGSPLLDPDHRGRYTCFYDGDTLMGYINLARMEDAVYFGIALAPDYCGRGYGPVVTRKAMAMAREKWPSLPLRLVVRIWNTRAIRCYEKAGFRPAGHPGDPYGAGGISGDEGKIKRLRRDSAVSFSFCSFWGCFTLCATA